jgi:diguanylate cyclase (GGDEF)-like protein
MKTLQMPKTESLRLKSVNALDIANNRPEEVFDSVVRLAAHRAGTPFAAFTVIGAEAQLFKATYGFNLQASRRSESFCNHTIQGSQILVVEDAAADPRFCDIPLVSKEPCIRFYAGIPVRSPSGFNVGTLCVVDRVRRGLEQEARQDLRDLAHIIETELLVRSMALRDHPTGFYNRDTFRRLADNTWRQARSAGVDVSMIIVSLDELRQAGHNAAENDALLRRISQCIRWTCNGTEYILSRDLPNRFSLLVLDEDGNNIKLLAESLRANLEHACLPHAATSSKVMINVGASRSARHPYTDYSIADLAERAHAAMRLAKDAGSRKAFLV